MLGALPGIREIRSALAGGYLWIVVLWLSLDPILGESDFKTEPYQSAQHLGEAVGPLALGVAVTFAAYLIGTFFNEVRTLVARRYLRARQSASEGPRPEGAPSYEARENRRQRRVRRRKFRRELLSEFLFRLDGFDRRAHHFPSTLTRTERVNRALFEFLSLLPRLLGKVIYASSALAAMLVELGETANEWINSVVRRLSSIRVEPYRPFVSEQGVSAIERYLNQKQSSDEGPTIADVIADFPVVRTRLIHASPDTVSEYDRLRAEADFRSAIFIPLAGILAILVIKVSPLWAAALLPLVIVLGTARAKRREAGDILADALGVVDAPSNEAAEAQPKAKDTPELTVPPSN